MKYIILFSAFCWIMHPCLKGAILRETKLEKALKNELAHAAVKIKCVENVKSQERVVNVKDFGVLPDGSDATFGIRQALDYCKRTHAIRLVVPKGTYNFKPDLAFERYLYISNNDEGLKRIVFDLTGTSDLEIDGQGSSFIFHGFVCPFVLENTHNVTIKDLSIDYTRTFHSEGKIVKSSAQWFDVRFDATFPYQIENGLLKFTGEGNVYPYADLLEFDPIKREPGFMKKDHWLWTPLSAELQPDKSVRIFKTDVNATVGNIMVFGAASRDCPAFTLTDSRDIRIEQVNIFHAGGMGVIAQRCHTVSLEQVRVTPAPNSNRVVSITADATHFVNCSGKITMKDCLFENQIDDATNIHGIYMQIDKIISPRKLLVKFANSGQYGFSFFQKGKKKPIELVHANSLIRSGLALVDSFSILNKEYILINLDKDIPEDIQVKDVIASAEEAVEVDIEGCTIRSNRARGLLIGSRGKTVIKDNQFHVPGAAILFEGDGRYWYEQAGVNDVLIQHNFFDNCLYGVWGNAVIQVGAGIEKNKRAISRYNKHIVIENNVFNVFNPRILNVYSLSNLVYKNNKIIKTEAYPDLYKNAKPFVVTDCSDIHIDPH